MDNNLSMFELNAVIIRVPSGALFYAQGWAGRKMLLHFLHFHHPWWSYIVKSHGWRCEYA